MTPQKLDKIKKKLGEDVIEELIEQDETGLRKIIADAYQAVETAKEEIAANPKYQDAKQAVKDPSAGLRDVRGYQGAKKQFALYRLRELDTK